MNRMFFILVLLMLCAGGREAQGRVVGDLRLHQLTSKIFGNTRTIRVLVPAEYKARHNRDKRYAVLYLNDGQNLFDRATAIFNPMEWQVDETAAHLIRTGKIDPVIVVGIDNPGRQLRAREYLPFEDKFLTPPEPNPEGQKYPDFMVSEVIPFINRHYRTIADAAGTAIGGSSYGAVAALYAVMAKPGVFGALLLESPSLYIDDGRLLEKSQWITQWPARVYIGVGTNEEGRQGCRPGDWANQAVQDVLRLQKTLQAAGLGPDRLRLRIADCAVHNEAAWAKRFPAAVEFLYGRK